MSMMEMMGQTESVVTWILIGLIWTIQLVHYPSFRDIAEDRFVEFEKKHTRSISILVVPLMLLELVISIAFMVLMPQNLKSIFVLLVVLGIWLSTFLLSVPCHQKLIKAKDTEVIERLIGTNWIRTILWSIKGFLVL